MKIIFIIVFTMIYVVNATPQRHKRQDEYATAVLNIFFSTEATAITTAQISHGAIIVVTPDSTYAPTVTPVVVNENQQKCTCAPYYQCEESKVDRNQLCSEPLDVCCIGLEATTTTPSCKCVPFHQCHNAENIDNTTIRIDIDDGVCPSYLEICCSLPSIEQNPTISTKIDVGCGIRNENGVKFTITGDKNNEAKFGEFPWMVALLKEDKTADDGKITHKYICGGSLIAPGVILTAAHCLENIIAQALTARAGEWDSQTEFEPNPHQDRLIRSAVIHPGYYHREEVFNDVALIFLTQPFNITQHVNTICLPQKGDNFDHSRPCIATGWGKDLFGGEGKYQVILKGLEIPIVPRSPCIQRLRDVPRLGSGYQLHPSFMCAGGEPGHDMCTGDGGSPLACAILNAPGRYVQAGIVSWGIGCGSAIPGIYANVAFFRNWIDEQMNSNNLTTKSYSYQ